MVAAEIADADADVDEATAEPADAATAEPADADAATAEPADADAATAAINPLTSTKNHTQNFLNRRNLNKYN